MTAAVEARVHHGVHARGHDGSPHDRRTAARERRVAQTAHGLSELLDRRPELAGTCPWATLAVEAVRWSV